MGQVIQFEPKRRAKVRATPAQETVEAQAEVAPMPPRRLWPAKLRSIAWNTLKGLTLATLMVAVFPAQMSKLLRWPTSAGAAIGLYLVPNEAWPWWCLATAVAVWVVPLAVTMALFRLANSIRPAPKPQPELELLPIESELTPSVPAAR